MAGDLRAVTLAAVDIGTNTALLLVASVDAAGRITTLADEVETPRLGRNVDASGTILPAGIASLETIVARYAAKAKSLGAGRIVACATSAVRDASNREELRRRVLGSAGVEIEVIDGATEADLTFRGALSGPGSAWSDPAVLDIGGGSTELCYAQRGATNGDRTLTAVSLPIGSVRLTERYFRHSPPLPAEVSSARMRILEELAPVVNTGFGAYTLVAVAGTATTLAGLHLGLPGFDRDAIDGCALPPEAVHAQTSRLLSMETGAIRALSTMTAGRADILPAGALILSSIVGHFGFREIRVSTRGLRYGIVLREWKRMRGIG